MVAAIVNLGVMDLGSGGFGTRFVEGKGKFLEKLLPIFFIIILRVVVRIIVWFIVAWRRVFLTFTLVDGFRVVVRCVYGLEVLGLFGEATLVRDGLKGAGARFGVRGACGRVSFGSGGHND